MSRISIQAWIWMSMGIFVLGFLLITVVSHVEWRRAEVGLATLGDAVLPAVQAGRDAETEFQRIAEDYQDAFVMEDSSGLERARVRGGRVLESLAQIAGNREVSAGRATSTRRLAREAAGFLAEADTVYGSAPSSAGRMGPEYQERVHRLATRTMAIRTDLRALATGLSEDLKGRIAQQRLRSASMRVFVGGIFGGALVLTVLLVNMTIRRTVLAPLAGAQRELAHERDLLRILMDHIPDAIYFKDEAGRFLRINRAEADMLGVLRPEDAQGHSDADYYDEEVARTTRAAEQHIFETGDPMVSKFEHLRRNGFSRWVTASKVRVRDEMRGSDLIVGISRDVTDWKNALDALERSTESFRLLFDAIPHAVWVYDIETLRLLRVNAAASRQYGYADVEFEHMTVADLHPPEEAARLQGTLGRIRECGAQNPPEGAWQYRTRSGDLLEVVIHSRLLRFEEHAAILSVVQDVTDRKRLELELQHAQRMEAVGQLAAGIAHEINTPIQFVGDNMQFLRNAFEDRQAMLEGYERDLERVVEAGQGSDAALEKWRERQREADMEYLAVEVPKALEQSVEGLNRVATIVRAMKAFAHPGRQEKAPADLNKALTDTLTVSRNEIKYVADVETDFGELPPVVCHLADLNQVFLNLLINAAHAISTVVQQTGGRGRIVVKTRAEAGHVTVSIGDTGCGIPAAIQSRVFDPFFTTKEVGRGTGQGLALARAIVVEKHGGRITFEPNPPQGTTFVVSLPLEGSSVPAECASVPEGIQA